MMETVMRRFLCRFAKPEEFQVSVKGIVSRSSGYSSSCSKLKLDL